MSYPPNSKCPCLSALPYKKCCGPLHKGNPAPTPQALMRSRFAAYALRMTGYIMKTTHPEGAHYQADANAWHKEILEFSSATRFKGLTILDAPAPLNSALTENEDDEAFVTFHAKLWARNEDHSFTEKSSFRRHDGQWKYFGAEFLDS